MKITTHTRPQGSALLLALLTAFVICIALTTYLYLVSNQNRSVMRSMAWNSSIPVVEAGVEEALTQVNYVGSTNLASNGWGAMSADGFFHKYNDLGNGFAYDVGVKPPLATGPIGPFEADLFDRRMYGVQIPSAPHLCNLTNGNTEARSFSADRSHTRTTLAAATAVAV